MLDPRRTIVVWEQGDLQQPIGTVATTGMLDIQAHGTTNTYSAGDTTVSARLIRSRRINFLLTDDSPLSWQGVRGFMPLGDEREHAYREIATWIETQACKLLRETSPVSATELASTVALMQEMAATIRAMGAVRQEDAA